MTGTQKASEIYSIELVSRNPKWHFLRVTLSLFGIPYARPTPFETDDLRQGQATPRFRLLIIDKASGDRVSLRNLKGASGANEAMAALEKDLEEMSVSEFREKYAISQ